MSGPHPSRAAASFDALGCLNEVGIQTLLSAPPGGAPEALAAHLAGCSRCQERLLAASVPGPRTRRAGRAPSIGRTLLILSLILLSLVLFFFTLRRYAVP